MITSRTTLLFLLLPLLMAGCTKQQEEKQKPKVIVAEVDGVQITGKQFMREYNLVTKRLQISASSDEKLEKQLRSGILAKMINALVLVHEAERGNIHVTKVERDEEMDRLLDGFSPARLQLVMEQSNTSVTEWKQRLKEKMLMQALVQQQLTPMVNIEEKDIKKYYKANKSEFFKDERVHAYHIVSESLSEADEIRNEIIYGANFEKMAKQHSISPDKDSGGDLGIFGHGQMPLEFDEVVFDLRVKQISRVVESPYGYHIFKVVKKFRPSGMKYKEAREIIYKRMFYDQLEHMFKIWIKEKREKAKVTVFAKQLYKL